MKVLDKSKCGTIVKMSEADIYLLTFALKAYGAQTESPAGEKDCDRAIAELNSGVHGG